MHERSKVKYPPFYVDGAGHNNLEKYAPDYLEKINDYLCHISGSDSPIKAAQPVSYEDDEEEDSSP